MMVYVENQQITSNIIKSLKTQNQDKPGIILICTVPTKSKLTEPTGLIWSVGPARSQQQETIQEPVSLLRMERELFFNDEYNLI